MNAALQPGTHGGAHPREGRNQVVPRISFGQNKQRDSVGILEGMGRSSYGWAHRPGQGYGTKFQPWVSLDWHFRQRNKPTKPCCPLTFQGFPPFVLGDWLQSKVSANLSTSTTESLSPPLNKGFILWLVVRLAMQMEPHGDPRSPSTQKAAGFLQPTLPPCTMPTLTAVSGYGGQRWDFMDFESNHTPHSLAELVPWDSSNHITGEAVTY